MRKLTSIFGMLLLGLCMSSCERLTPKKYEVVEVSVPPFYDQSLSAGQNYCRYDFWRHPPPESAQRLDLIACKNLGIPNDGGIFLQVRLDDNGTISLNNEKKATKSNLVPLTDSLRQIFETRQSMGVYEEGTENVVREIGIKASPTSRYGDVVELVLAIKKSGADPIILVLDGHLGSQEEIINLK